MSRGGKAGVSADTPIDTLADAPSPYKENRRQGPLSFPCTMYTSDSREYPEGTPFYVKPHWHDAFEILHFERGDYTVSINMERFKVSGEAFGLVRAGMIHTVECREGYLEQAVLFEPEILSFSASDAAGRELLDPFVRRELTFPFIIREGERGFSDLRACFEEIRGVFERSAVRSGDQLHVTAAGAQLRIKAGLLTLLCALSDNDCLLAARTRPDPRAEAMKKVMTYIRENYASRIYIADLAQIMNMNEQYFCRLFKRTIGKTPVAYINEVRIRQAAALLERSSLSVAETANECGYGNLGHFISEFRRQTGRTPLEYRRRYEEKHT